MLSLVISHTRYRNLHKYLIDLLTIHMIQYSSGYDSRFPRKRSWFESQLGNNIYVLLFSVCVCCFYFDLLSFFISVSTIRQLLHLGIKSHKAVDILYRDRNSAFSCVHTHHACITAIFDPRMKFLCSKTCLKGVYYISHNLLFELPKIATFIAHKNKLLK